MACTGDGSTGVKTGLFRFMNWARTNIFVVPVTLNPTDVRQLAAAIVQAEAEGGTVKAMGSGWSYTTAAVDDSVTHLINTAFLNRQLSVHPGHEDEEHHVIPRALRTDIALPPLIHVEAGITIYELNFLLQRQTVPLAMKTMGGANGQTLAGVLSTGTHGADYNEPPIADAVRAIHLVGPSGQEWWIEPDAASAITSGPQLEAVRTAGILCADLKIVYDTMLFRAALVSLGRMGVIYSVVLEVRPAFKLIQTRAKSDWMTELAWIRDTVVPAQGGPVPGRFREIVVNPYPNAAGLRECIVTSREETTLPDTSAPASSGDPFTFVCDIQGLDGILVAALVLIPVLVGVATAAALASISFLLLIPLVGGLLYALAVPGIIAAATVSIVALETAISGLLAAGPGGVAEKLAGVCNLASAIGQQAIVRDIVGAFVGLLRPTGGAVVMDGFRLMTDQVQMFPQPRPDDPDCMRRIDGFEFAFDLSTSVDALDAFLGDIFALTDAAFASRTPMAFGMSVRLTGQTKALIGMQQGTRTAHVEFFFLRGFTGQSAFYQRLHTAARDRGARPHWGLIHRLDAARVDALYGANLTDWRKCLGRIITESGGSGKASTFRTTFSIDRNLEPLYGCALPPMLIRWIDRLNLRLKWSRVMRALVEKPRKGPSNDAG